jgi:hypothetical protein
MKYEKLHLRHNNSRIERKKNIVKVCLDNEMLEQVRNFNSFHCSKSYWRCNHINKNKQISRVLWDYKTCITMEMAEGDLAEYLYRVITMSVLLYGPGYWTVRKEYEENGDVRNAFLHSRCRM